MAIDRNPVALARQELRAAARAALAAVQAVRPTWSQEVVATRLNAKVGRDSTSRSALSRLIGPGDESIPPGFGGAFDEMCAELGVGAFRLAVLQEAWELRRDDLSHARQEQHLGRVRESELLPEPALALQPRTELLERIVSTAAGGGASAAAVGRVW